MTTIDKIKAEYPLHWSVWNDDHKNLQDQLKTGQVSQTELIYLFVYICFASKIAHCLAFVCQMKLHYV